MDENPDARKDEVLHFLVAFVLRLALLVMCVDVCAMPERRAHTSVIAFGGMCG
jgi:hypothetical protein